MAGYPSFFSWIVARETIVGSAKPALATAQDVPLQGSAYEGSRPLPAQGLFSWMTFRACSDFPQYYLVNIFCFLGIP